MQKVLFWFRNDLRLNDQVALFEAINKSDKLLPVYCVDLRLFEKTSLGFDKIGYFRAKFLLESLQDLRANLIARNSNLLIKIGHPEQVIPELCSQYQINYVFASKEITTYEVDQENALEKQLWKLSIPFHLIWQSTLYHIEDIPWPIRNLPDIFTNFRKEVESTAQVRACIESPAVIPTVSMHTWGDIPTLDDLGLRPQPLDDRSVVPLSGGETAAVERLEHYLWETKALGTYKNTRNELLGIDYSSKFSPYLAAGCISPRYIARMVQTYENKIEKNESTYWLVFELLWRDYFRFVAKKYGSKIFQKNGISSKSITYSGSSAHFELWKNGETGVPFIDANMKELKATGYMSNRGRQNVASFLVKDLNVDWRFGALWFESQLIDYDPCSNYANWLYVAGLGNDPRETRYFNILSQAARYDSKGSYVRAWLPQLKHLPNTKIHSPAELTTQELSSYEVILGDNYPEPIINYKKWLVGSH
jgi:deoxyribodipyrimidine photo-lyase